MCELCAGVSFRKKKERRNNLLKTVFERNCITKHEWSLQREVLQIQKEFEQHLPLLYAMKDKLLVMLYFPTHVRTLTTRDAIYHNNECVELAGARFPPDYKPVEVIGDNFLTAPKDSSLGLIRIGNSGDFIIINNINYAKQQIMALEELETEEIFKGTLSKRAGAAGGVVKASSNSSSLSACTKNANNPIIPAPHGPGGTVCYINKDSQVKTFGIYNDIRMRRLDSKQKFIEIEKSVTRRHIIIIQMVDRLRGCLVLLNKGLIDGNKHLMDLQRITTEHKTDTVVESYCNLGHTCGESIMLAWAASTGVMYNHSALACHFDGNTAHPVETLSLFARRCKNKEKTKHSIENSVPGYLLFPAIGLNLKMMPGRDIVHCGLKSTYHIPDNTRNSHNWTVVHGPK